MTKTEIHVDSTPALDHITVFPQAVTYIRAIEKEKASKASKTTKAPAVLSKNKPRAYCFRPATEMRGETLASILNQAADSFLQTEESTTSDALAISQAINKAINKAFPYGYLRHSNMSYSIKNGLEQLGFKMNDDAQFSDIPESSRKEFRAVWLKFAAHMAQEQGV